MMRISETTRNTMAPGTEATKTAALVVALLLPTLASSVAGAVSEPTSPRREGLVEFKYGRLFADPYRWMEDPNDAELSTWIAAHNARVTSDLHGDLYDDVVAEFRAIFDALIGGSSSGASAASSGTQAPNAQRDHTTPSHLFPTQGSPFTSKSSQLNGLTRQITCSSSGRFEIVLESDSNGELKRLGVVDHDLAQEDGQRWLSDTLTVRTPQVFFEPGEKSFLYVTQSTDRPGSPQRALYRHVLGTLQSADELIFALYGAGDRFELFHSAESGWLIQLTYGDGTQAVARFDMQAGPTDSIVPPTTHHFVVTSIDKGQLYVIDFAHDPMGELATYDLVTGARQVVVSQTQLGDRAIDASCGLPVETTDSYLVTVIEDAAHKVVHIDKASGNATDIAVPVQGSACLFVHNGAVYARLTDYTQFVSSWRLDLSTGEAHHQQGPADLPLGAELQAERVFYTAHNGQQAPIWIVRSKDTALTPDTPLLLQGYGGFGENRLPRIDHSLRFFPWYLRGGAVGFVTLPGGAEYGQQWHDAGRLENKTHVFADFERAAEHLIALGYTSPAKLAALGGSNGGLLVAAVVNRRPDLFAAAIPEAGVLDMLRYEATPLGSIWAGEYGTASEKESFQNLFSYSPYHNIRNGPLSKLNPAVMIVTSDLDDRVMPWHSFKYAARLMHRSRSDQPIYLRTRPWSSHAGTPRIAEKIADHALKTTFLLRAVAMASDDGSSVSIANP